MTYKLGLPATGSTNLLFHILMLKKCVRSPEKQITPLNLCDTSSVAFDANLVEKVPFSIMDNAMNTIIAEIEHALGLYFFRIHPIYLRLVSAEVYRAKGKGICACVGLHNEGSGGKGPKVLRLPLGDGLGIN
ncbi:hypothetical protein HAX54_042586, partial [Datura stramonium]|nr:hypothetical protein [Datura stramonium]